MGNRRPNPLRGIAGRGGVGSRAEGGNGADCQTQQLMRDAW